MIDGISVRSAPPVKPPAGEKETALRKTARDLEGLFVQQLFKSMRETVPEGEGIVSGGAGEDIFTGLLDQHLAAETPKQWQSGIAEALYRQLRGIAAPGGSGPQGPAASGSPSASAAPLTNTGSSAI
jgi:flagellar protein FlgJ